MPRLYCAETYPHIRRATKPGHCLYRISRDPSAFEHRNTEAVLRSHIARLRRCESLLIFLPPGFFASMLVNSPVLALARGTAVVDGSAAGTKMKRALWPCRSATLARGIGIAGGCHNYQRRKFGGALLTLGKNNLNP